MTIDILPRVGVRVRVRVGVRAVPEIIRAGTNTFLSGGGRVFC